MIILDDWRQIAFLSVICALLLTFCLIASDVTKPDCPSGSVATHTRSGWYCVVEPLHK